MAAHILHALAAFVGPIGAVGAHFRRTDTCPTILVIKLTPHHTPTKQATPP